MNAPIFRLFALFVVLFARAGRVQLALGGVRRHRAAREPEEQPRGDRGAADQARRDPRRRRRGAGRQHGAARTSATSAATRPGELFAQPVGFDSVRFGRAGLERYYNDQLTGRKEELARSSTRWSSATRSATTCRRRSTRRPRRSPTTLLGDRKGAVVALDVKTGAVRVLAGNPSFDPTKPDEGSIVQPRDPGPVPARLDVQDRDGGRGARLRPLPAGLARERQERQGDLAARR